MSPTNNYYIYISKTVVIKDIGEYPWFDPRIKNIFKEKVFINYFSILYLENMQWHINYYDMYLNINLM